MQWNQSSMMGSTSQNCKQNKPPHTHNRASAVWVMRACESLALNG